MSTPRTLTMSFSLRLPLHTLATLIKWQTSLGKPPRNRSEAVNAALQALILNSSAKDHQPANNEEALKLVHATTTKLQLSNRELCISRGGIEQTLNQTFKSVLEKPVLEKPEILLEDLSEPDPEEFRLKN